MITQNPLAIHFEAMGEDGAPKRYVYHSKWMTFWAKRGWRKKWAPKRYVYHSYRRRKPKINRKWSKWRNRPSARAQNVTYTTPYDLQNVTETKIFEAIWSAIRSDWRTEENPRRRARKAMYTTQIDRAKRYARGEMAIHEQKQPAVAKNGPQTVSNLFLQ